MLPSWTSPPPSQGETRWPFAWDRVGKRFRPPLILVDKVFLLVHYILPLRGRLASMGAAADGTCAHCWVGEDVAHFFQHCPRLSVHWDSLYVKLLSVVPGFSSDWDLLMLAFPVCPASVERSVVDHLGVLVAKL
jgi:hypothetical protein